MSQFTEQEVQLHFLEEAQDYLNEIESGILGLSQADQITQTIDALLRAAHSIKGGAALMGFEILSDLSHRLEDAFKVLRSRKRPPVEAELEQLLLQALDGMRKVILHNRQGVEIDRDWLRRSVMPSFRGLHRILGDPTPEDETSLMGDEAGNDMVLMLFESEVGGCLERLDKVLQDPQRPCLIEEVAIAAQELSGLAEMLDLPRFGELCQSVTQALEESDTPERKEAIAELAVAEWNRVKAMVMIGQSEAIPRQLDIASIDRSLADSNPPTLLLNDAEINHTLDALDDICMVLPPTPSSASTKSEQTSLAEEVPLNAMSDLEELSDTTEILDHSAHFSSRVAGLDEEISAILDFDSAEIETFANDLDADLKELPEQELDDTLLSNKKQSHSSGKTPSINEDTPISESNQPNPTLEELLLDEPTLIKTTANAQQQESGEDTPVPEANSSQQTLEELLSEPTPIRTTAKAQKQESDEVSVPSSAPRELPTAAISDVAASPIESTATQTVRVAVQQLQHLGEQFGELVIERNSLQQQLAQMRDLMNRLNGRVSTLQKSNHRLRSVYDRTAVSESAIANSQSRTIANGFDTLEMDHYGSMHLISQELMETAIQIQEVSEDVNLQLDEAEQTTRELIRTTKHLQNSITQIRMRPISELLNRFPRVLRDLGFQYGKSVKLSIKGGGTLIDRTILDELNDPLMHLIRNAFDHGIEPVATRRNRGKPDEGTIEIAASYRGNQSVITVSDDGDGIALDKIREKAHLLGVSDTQLTNASDQDLLELVFEPGFSTADSVTQLSGRGVGMDVVRHNLQKIRGTISIETKPGVGTTFTIKVPFNLSIVRSLLIESQQTLFAVPTDAVQEIVISQPDSIRTAEGQSMLTWEGQAIPLFRLGEVLRFPYAPPLRNSETAPLINQPLILLFEDNKQLVGLQVDRYWGEQEVTVRQVEGSLPLPLGCSGCTILGDGRIAPLLEMTTLLKHLQSAAHLENQSNDNRPEQPRRNQEGATVMVVDDSVNVRRFLAKMLEKSGFQIEQAQNGQHALEKLRSGLSVQAVICDLEMPQLDGFGFLSHVKSDYELKEIPVIMLTSRGAQKHRNLAKTLGATAYFCKPFREQELLQTLTDTIKL